MKGQVRSKWGAGCKAIVVGLGVWWWTGCAAAVPVAGDVAGTAIDKTGEIVRAGKVESYQRVKLEEAVGMVRRVAEEMELKSVGQDKHPDQLKLTYTDDRKLKVVVTLVRRTAQVTQIRVDVGLFGEEGMAQLVMRRILGKLPQGAGEGGTATEAAGN